jgi:WD40 repeat protein
VWDIQAQKLDSKVGKPQGGLALSHVPVFWTTKDRTIVTAFCFTDGNNDCDKTIYEFDSSTLETVGTPFEAHTDHVTGLALSNDSTLLASASLDFTLGLRVPPAPRLIRSTCYQLLYPFARLTQTSIYDTRTRPTQDLYMRHSTRHPR